VAVVIGPGERLVGRVVGCEDRPVVPGQGAPRSLTGPS
jgi:hypothetical protein